MPTFVYDAVGNRLVLNANGTRTTTVCDNANQIRYSTAAAGRTTYTFDANGNQQIVREPSGARTTTTWNYKNQPTMASASGTGATPLRVVDFVGHSWTNANSIGSSMQGNGNGTLNLSDFDAYQRRFVPGLVDPVGEFKWQSELARAMNSEFSVPCWFAVDSEVTMAGCITNNFAGNFADTILRNGGAFARGSSKPTWYLRNPLRMGWGNADATAPAANPDFKSTRPEYLESDNWVLHEGIN